MVGSMVLPDTDVPEVMAMIGELPNRFRNYLVCTGKRMDPWSVEVPELTGSQAQLRLVDHRHEYRRGRNARSEAPVFHITVQQDGENVMLSYKLKWDNLVCVLAWVFAAIAASILGVGIYWILAGKLRQGSGMLFCGAFLAVVAVIWFLQEKLHDQKTVVVFEDVIRRAFGKMKNLKKWAQKKI